MKNVLMIAYDFPPIAKSGVQRTVKFVKYLPLFGWNPIVLTVKRREEFLEASDLSFLDELPKDLKIYRSKVIEPYDIYKIFGGKSKQGSDVFYFENTNCIKGRLSNLIGKFLVPDAKIGWYPFAVRDAKQIFDENNVDMIFSTAPKMTALLIGMTLSKKYNIPWVADFRDPWMGWNKETEDIRIKQRPLFFRRWDEHLERKVINKANTITSVMEEINKDFIERYPAVDSKKFITISHGFDSADFKDIQAKDFQKFTIIYTGTFYKGRDPQKLLEALKLLLDINEKLRNDVQVIFVGNEYYNTKKLIDMFKLGDIVKSIPNIPHKECLRYLLGAHLCYFNTVTTRNALPVKLFDYIASKKPILALIPENSPTARLIRQTKSGVVIAPQKIWDIKDAILSFYNDYKEGFLKLNRDDNSIIYQFERKKQTQQLAKIFDELC